jgi:hypothetical protein
MKQLKKIKLSDLVKEEKLDVNSLSKMTAGINVYGSGCTSGICVNNREYGASMFCTNDSTCESGIDVCHENT